MPTVRGFSVTVGTTPVALASNGATDPQLIVSVQNPGSGGILYAGGSNVVAGQGFAIASNGTLTATVAGGRLYGVSQASQTVTGFEVI